MKNYLKNLLIGSVIVGSLTTGGFGMQSFNQIKNALTVITQDIARTNKIAEMVDALLPGGVITCDSFVDFFKPDKFEALNNLPSSDSTTVFNKLKDKLRNIIMETDAFILFSKDTTEKEVKWFFDSLSLFFDSQELATLPLKLSFNAGAAPNEQSSLTEFALITIVKKFKGIKKIVLHSCEKAVTDNFIVELASNCPNFVLEVLDLCNSCSKLTPESHLENLVQEGNKLKQIVLHSCPSAVTDKFIKALQKNCSKLQILNLNFSCDNLSSHPELFEKLSNCKDLQALYLCGWKKLAGKSIQNLKSKTLKFISLMGGKIDSESIKKLCTNCPSLVNVLLDGLGPNVLNDEVIAYMSPSLQKLVYLNLSNNNSFSVKAIASVITNCSRLRTVYLKDTKLGNLQFMDNDLSNLLTWFWVPIEKQSNAKKRKITFIGNDNSTKEKTFYRGDF